MFRVPLVFGTLFIFPLVFLATVQDFSCSRVYAGQIVVTGPFVAMALALLRRNLHLGVKVLFFFSLKVLCDSVLTGELLIHPFG